MRFLTLLPLMTVAQVAAAEPASDGIVGAWTSGDTAQACETAPITLLMSDGVVAVFMSKDGDLHSLGSWTATVDTLTMTHNDFPLSGDGQSKAPVELTILDLSETRFITRNAKGDIRERIKCNDIMIKTGHDGEPH
mmetsp:Transcript_19117/g.24745  ORF Transcript_19117/g.24745 Transcript_19117/m.24745 type:complete len:136 (+) Transcript_19117:245-652(+)|eukprot:CAMPEP_0184454560 /NCGR_PEP_ID=MMETSP0740-20130409/20435_1 /TAXON_ID=385413 /ORGANISM="Thalassiosira miniscula, Strain CCMP1093" /LENGTH=135 /DNA_ID=CAMNT_0026826151 /DNA_START=242 /DNA_END=649 /DNA_ORIENTATION=-